MIRGRRRFPKNPGNPVPSTLGGPPNPYPGVPLSKPLTGPKKGEEVAQAPKLAQKRSGYGLAPMIRGRRRFRKNLEKLVPNTFRGGP